MSHVTNLILTTRLIEDERPATLTKIEGLGFARVDQHAGGGKAMERTVWLAAFNHLSIDALVAQLRAIEWERPESVQLFVSDEGEYLFDEHELAIPFEDDGA